MESFSYTSHADFFFLIWGVSLTHPVLASFFFSLFFFLLFFLLFLNLGSFPHVPCWLHFYVGNFSYTSHACFIFLWGVSLTHPGLAYFYFYFFKSRAGFIFMWGISLTHPVLALFFCGECLLHIPCLLYFSVGSFSYTFHADFFFFYLGRFFFFWFFFFLIWGVSLTRPVLAFFFFFSVFFFSFLFF